MNLPPGQSQGREAPHASFTLSHRGEAVAGLDDGRNQRITQGNREEREAFRATETPLKDNYG